jgi:hydroxymethylglutaryl-CoA lyase
MSDRASVREVGLRDGLQLVGKTLPTERKVEWCRREAAIGMKEIEVTSFVPARLIPQFADAEDVVRAVADITESTIACLVPNLKGAQRAMASGARKINYVLSASEEHNLSNVRRTTAESIEDFRRIIEHRKRSETGRRVEVGAGIATAFGCAISGPVSERRVLQIAATLLEAGADELIIADTVGYASPAQVRRILSAVTSEAGHIPVVAHFHDTRGLGLANVTAALDAGVRMFDASLGGLGGCPFAPGASGNIDIEDCVYLLDSMGFETGVDISGLLEIRRMVAAWMPEEHLNGAIARAGLPKNYRQIVEMV